MGSRITVMLDDDLATQIRNKQAAEIKRTNHSVSFSKILNEVLEKGLQGGRS